MPFIILPFYISKEHNTQQALNSNRGKIIHVSLGVWIQSEILVLAKSPVQHVVQGPAIGLLDNEHVDKFIYGMSC
jgi:hypothetical protein